MNGQRGISTLGAVLLAATAGLLTATLMMDWMVVDVHVVDVSENDDLQVDAPLHIRVPFPLLIADIATADRGRGLPLGAGRGQEGARAGDHPRAS